jgi:hypothetical protein
LGASLSFGSFFEKYGSFLKFDQADGILIFRLDFLTSIDKNLGDISVSFKIISAELHLSVS